MKTKYRATGILILIVLVVLFFSSALRVQHALAGADFSGHVHSGFDLCDWLKIQTTASLSLDEGTLWQFLCRPGDTVIRTGPLTIDGLIISFSSPRAPPIYNI
jgi:hypothetical protein